MHHALQIHEILLSIFGHCESFFPPCNHSNELAALARTCRTFKESALDILWSELFDFSPLVRCVPRACQFHHGTYSFSRPLSEVEWDTVRNYARRVRIMHDCHNPSQPNRARSLVSGNVLDAFFAAPLFPNLRCLQWRRLDRIPVVHVAVLSLTSIMFDFAYRSARVHSSFFSDVASMNLAPNVKRFKIHLFQGHPFDDTISKAICHWKHLCVVDCFLVTLSADAILHLSRIPSLMRLHFTLGDKATDSHLSDTSSLVFSHLTYLSIGTCSLERLTRFFSGIRLPALQTFIVRVFGYLGGQTVDPFMIAMRPTCSVESLIQFQLTCDHCVTLLQKKSVHLDRLCTVHDVHPLMAFSRLRSLSVTLQWFEVPKDDELLEWVTAWPDLEELSINSRPRLVYRLCRRVLQESSLDKAGGWKAKESEKGSISIFLDY